MDARFTTMLRGVLKYAGEQEFTADSRLRDLGLDSMSAITLLFAIEDGYGVSLPDDKLVDATFDTAGGLWAEVSAAGRRVMSALADAIEATASSAREADADAEFPIKALSALRTSGLLGLVAPVEYGGEGGGFSEVVDATIALSREDMSVGMIFAMHCQQAMALARYASPRLRAELLPALVRGELYLASVTTETGTGGGLLTSESTVTEGDGLLNIDREAPIVTGGPHADGFLITTLAPDATAANQVSLVYAARDQLKLEVTGGWNPLGMRATHSVPMRLTGAVPADQLIGKPGEFRTIVAQLFGPAAHIGWSAAWLGTTAGALSRVLHLIRSRSGRRSFDPSSELLLTRLARIRARIDAVHALLRHTVSAVDSAEDRSAAPVQLLVNTLKTQAAEQCFTAINELVELVGLRHGYLRDSPLFLERALRDLRSASLNYANERLYLVNGALALLDQEVRLTESDSSFPRAAIKAVTGAADDGRAVWQDLGRAGLLADLFDEGPGPRLDRTEDLLTVLDARFGIGTVLSVCVQVASALPILRAAADTGPAAKAYEAALRGDAMLALAVTDTDAAGSDLLALGTTATLTDESIQLDGGKSWITNACTADYALVLARHRPGQHFTNFLWALVPTDAPGVSAERAGSRFAGAGLGHLRLDGVRLGRDHLLGAPGRGLPTFARHVATERIAGAFWARAMCRRVLADTHGWLDSRTVGGRPLWHNDAVRERFARCLVELRRIDAMCAQHVATAHTPDALLSSMLLKASTAHSLDLVLTECVALRGADAYRHGGLADLRAETAMFGIAGGATGAMLAGIAEHATSLVGSP